MPKPKSFDEDEVLTKVMKLFWAKGYSATTLNDILDHLGIGKQSLYNAFGDKNSLFHKTLDKYEVMSKIVLTPLNSPFAGMIELRNYFLQEHSAFSQPEIELKACMMGNTLSALDENDKLLQQKVRDYLSLIETSFYNTLQNMQKNGEIASSRDISILARYLLNNGYGLGLLGRSGMDSQDMVSMVEVILSAIK